MAKGAIEKAMEKAQKENKKIAEQEARRQRASAIVNGQPIIGGMRIMDPSSEEILKIVLEQYDGNEDRFVQGDTDLFPKAYRFSVSQVFETLSMYGMTTLASLYLSGIWELNLMPQGITYFEDKEKALAKAEEEEKHRPLKSTKEYDVFISHANKDKSEYVDSLYVTIKRLGVRVFYDTEEIDWGDNWKQVILNGTEKSEFAIIVISENFFDREWTERELSEFLKRQNKDGQKIVLPLIHNITLDQLKEKYPELGDIQAISTERYYKEDIAILFAKELIKRLR